MNTESLWLNVRNHPLRQRDVPLEAALSYPVPVLQGFETVFRFFLYRVDRSQEHGMAQVRAPFARLTVIGEGRLIEYLHRDWSDPFPGLQSEGMRGEARNPALKDLTPKEIAARRSALFRQYDAVLAIYPREPTDATERAAIKAFQRDFLEIVEPPLIPYYEALGTEFFAWLRSESSER